MRPTTAWLPTIAAIHEVVDTVVFQGRGPSRGDALLDCYQGNEVGFADYTDIEGIEVQEGPIAILSLGGPHRLVLTDIEAGETHQFMLTPGGLLVLNRTSEWCWQAAPTKKSTGPWINLAFLRPKLGRAR